MPSYSSEMDEVLFYIKRHIDEDLSLARLARYAAYSPYHFSRIFKAYVGLPPHYYVASIRLQKAKDLLLKTNLSIRDIGMEIGQQSLGTFTTRFSNRVGMSPSAFRHSPQVVNKHLTSLNQLATWKQTSIVKKAHNYVTGTIDAEVPFSGVILIGLFPKPIPEGMPKYGTLLSTLGEFSFSNVKPGRYYLMATAVTWDSQATDILLPHTTLRAKIHHPIVVQPRSSVPHLYVTLRAPRLNDPPILVSLPVLMNNFLRQQG
ncbi:helix-turn-helix transcriptional regulator [Virgibacillus sp. AGTR]|nr:MULTISPECIES: helix-turn-helix transcriptional regulator [unclassified Virgibacillus]MCC2251197.1 helix-turn-helix transcriptional regulator [Virgibacillus sp. AGTR]QRZ18720.1 helix-turn-helix transcriptional regulator [Virgibacillus sp. AGTR]